MINRTLFALLASIASIAAQAQTATTIEMRVDGLVCAFCAQGIEKTLRRNSATADVLVSLERQLVAVALRDGRDIADAELRKALTDAGYAVRAIERTDRPLAAIRASLRGKPQ